jgi:NTP pyrophosphatase (non-canonical NTP hydrolase)
MGWRWDGGHGGFIVAGPVEGAAFLEAVGWFPPDAPVGWTTATGTERLTFDALLARGAIPAGVEVTLPGNPTGVGPAAYVMERLLGPDGCPWDRQQTPRSLIRYLLDEPYEAAAAILAENWDLLEDELGDVLLQVLFQSALQQRAGRYGLADVARRQAQKLVRRHPHVFGDEPDDDVLGRWEARKAAEGESAVGDETVMPALMALSRAIRRGYVPPDAAGYETWREAMRTWLQESAGDDRARVVTLAAALVAAARERHVEAEWVVWEALMTAKSS